MTHAIKDMPAAAPRSFIHEDVIQGTDEWYQLRCGLLTASEMKLIITPGKLQAANNDKMRGHFYELMAQRTTEYVEPHYISDDMLRGDDDEKEARDIYTKNFAPVQEVGFITNDKWGFTLGYSPDGLVGDDGLIEIKSRCQKWQMQTIMENAVPDEYMIQIQTGLLVSEREWCDFISYCGGLPLYPKRVYADEKIQTAIIAAATAFEDKMKEALAKYDRLLESPEMRLIPTERRIEQEMFM
jgi:predicted phage-related endonuclease